jgi:hypothetical protein
MSISDWQVEGIFLPHREIIFHKEWDVVSVRFFGVRCLFDEFQCRAFALFYLKLIIFGYFISEIS